MHAAVESTSETTHIPTITAGFFILGHLYGSMEIGNRLK